MTSLSMKKGHDGRFALIFEFKAVIETSREEMSVQISFYFGLKHVVILHSCKTCNRKGYLSVLLEENSIASSGQEYKCTKHLLVEGT